jgi:hypothetical protein
MVPLYLTLLSLAFTGSVACEHTHPRRQCLVKPGGSNATDDAPAIRRAFAECGRGGDVMFEDSTYYINSVMNITGLKDCRVHLNGYLLARVPSTRSNRNCQTL